MEKKQEEAGLAVPAQSSDGRPLDDRTRGHSLSRATVSLAHSLSSVARGISQLCHSAHAHVLTFWRSSPVETRARTTLGHRTGTARSSPVDVALDAPLAQPFKPGRPNRIEAFPTKFIWPTDAYASRCDAWLSP